MSIKPHNGKYKKAPSQFMLILMVCLCLLSAQATANTQDYQLEEVAQLTHNSIKDSSWKQAVVNPNNKQQYFIFNESGQLHLVDEELSAKALLDLNKSNHDKQNFSFTAMALHPNFSLRDQSGFGVIYTAHLEPINKKNTTKRIQERSSELTLTYDAVITEWTFNTITYQQVDESTKREVLRIGLPNNELSIKQMSFNPSIKSWNDDFGLLHIALNGDEKWRKPLYSGVILRINPDKFGLRSFTVPANNPFLKDAKINDAIYALGAQHIKQFIWPDKNTDRILLLHRYGNNDLLSMVSNGNDFREQGALKVAKYKSVEPINSIALYKGRQLTVLRNKLLFLQNSSTHWQMYSLPLSVTSAIKKEQQPPTVEWQLPAQQFLTINQLSLVSNFLSELLLLDNTNKLLYRFNQENSTPKVVDVKPLSTDRDYSQYALLAFALLILIAIGVYLVKFNKVSAKKLVRKQYASLKLSESNQQISLYHRHKKSADAVIEILDIVSSRVLLNEQSICLINLDVKYGFSNAKEKDLRDTFTKEHVEKMVDGKLRQITLQLVDKQKHTYTICLYMRKGSDRITKKSYGAVIDDLVDWCWLIAQQINPNNTEKRKVIEKPSVNKKPLNNKNKEVPLHHQASAVKPVTYSNEGNQAAKTDTVNMQKETNADEDQVKQTQFSETHKEASTVDTELVDALEKLVDLKQQGFLTSEEFSQAKAKLFENLFDNK